MDVVFSKILLASDTLARTWRFAADISGVTKIDTIEFLTTDAALISSVACVPSARL